MACKPKSQKLNNILSPALLMLFTSSHSIAMEGVRLMLPELGHKNFESYPTLMDDIKASSFQVIYDALIEKSTDALELVKNHPEALNKYIISGPYEGYTLTHLAVYTGKADVVEYVLKYYQSAAFLKSREGYTILHSASSSGDVDIIELILHFAPVLCLEKDYQGCTALHTAAYHNKIDVLKYLAPLFPDLLTEKIYKQKFDVLSLAVLYGDLEIVKYLLSTFPHLLMRDPKTPPLLHVIVGNLNVLEKNGKMKNVWPMFEYLAANFPDLIKAKDTGRYTVFHKLATNPPGSEALNHLIYRCLLKAYEVYPTGLFVRTVLKLGLQFSDGRFIEIPAQSHPDKVAYAVGNIDVAKFIDQLSLKKVGYGRAKVYLKGSSKS